MKYQFKWGVAITGVMFGYLTGTLDAPLSMKVSLTVTWFTGMYHVAYAIKRGELQ